MLKAKKAMTMQRAATARTASHLVRARRVRPRAAPLQPMVLYSFLCVLTFTSWIWTTLSAE